MPPILSLTPRYVPKIWGGQRLQPDTDELIGEAWIVAGDSRVAGGRLAGATLDELARDAPHALLGRPSDDYGFPLLIKLLEATEWLSVQVHPDDALATELEGPGSRGKTEAWYVIDASPGAELIVGLRDGVSIGELEAVASDRRVLDLLTRTPVRAGDAFFMPAGTVHAIGPGVLIYEVQQMSDITYRMYDWERPATAGRMLHLEQSLRVLRSLEAQHETAHRNRAAGDVERVVCDYFTLEELTLTNQARVRDTEGRSFHAITALNGHSTVTAGNDGAQLGARETVLVPASSSRYTLSADGTATVLVSSLPAV